MSYEPTEDRESYPDNQLVPLRGGRYKTIFKGPPGTDVGDLHCDLEIIADQRDGQEVTYQINHSGWSLSFEQMSQLLAGGHIRLTVHQNPIPPLSVSVEPPVDRDDNPMVWDQATGAYMTVDLARAIQTLEAVDGVPAWMSEDTVLPVKPEESERQVRGDFTSQPPDPDED